jgi:IS5 family transposase
MPTTVAADPGYGERAVEDALHDIGVRWVVIPRKGNPAQRVRARNIVEQSAATSNGAPAAKAGFSTLKRGYG